MENNKTVTVDAEDYDKLSGKSSSQNVQVKEREVSIVDIVNALLKRWWLILIITIVGAASGFAVFFTTYNQTYQATAKMYVNNGSISFGSTKLSISSGDLAASQSLVNTYCEILKTRLTLNEVIKQCEEDYGYNLKYATLLSKISVSAVNDTEIFSITVTDSVPQKAINIANKIVDVLPNQIAIVIDGSSVRTVDRAVDAKEVSPTAANKVMLGAAFGFVIACFYVFAYDYYFNDTIESSEWLRINYPSISILAEIPDVTIHHSGKYGKYGKYSKYGKYYKSSYYRSSTNSENSKKSDSEKKSDKKTSSK